MAKTVKKEFVIDRSNWLTREFSLGYGESGLLHRPTGLMCCMGHVCSQMGAGTRALAHAYPYEGRTTDSLFNQLGIDEVLQGRIAKVNDYGPVDVRERERELKKLFKQAGVKITFKGRMPKFDESMNVIRESK